jgi:hypothetical protein
MLSLGFGGSEDDPARPDLEEKLADAMMALLIEHGWSFSTGRDPVLILIEIEEYLTNSDTESDD